MDIREVARQYKVRTLKVTLDFDIGVGRIAGVAVDPPLAAAVVKWTASAGARKLLLSEVNDNCL